MYKSKKLQAAIQQWCEDHNETVIGDNINVYISYNKIVDDNGVQIKEGMDDEVAPEEYDNIDKMVYNVSRRKGVSDVQVIVTCPDYDLYEEKCAELEEWPFDDVRPNDMQEPFKEFADQILEEQERAIRAAQEALVDANDAKEISEADEGDGWVSMAAAARYVGVIFQQVQQRTTKTKRMPRKLIKGVWHVNLKDLDIWRTERDEYFLRKTKREFAPVKEKKGKRGRPVQVLFQEPEIDDDRVEGEESADFSEVVNG